MDSAANLPKDLQEALNGGLLKRLPLTFLPFVNQQLHEWDYLFPNERRSVQRLLIYVASLDSAQSEALFRDVLQLEAKMGVAHWQFSTTEQTIQNSSLLARSPYFQEWRQAVQAVFNAADQYAIKAGPTTSGSRNRLVLMEIPSHLPLDERTAWSRWQGIGRTWKLAGPASTQPASATEFLLFGQPDGNGGFGGGLLGAAPRLTESASSATWMIDAGSSLIDTAMRRTSHQENGTDAILLSYRRLSAFRESFSHEMNTMQKDLADADAVFDRLRKVDVTAWCPSEIVSQPAVREFVRSLYLSGNGAVIFGNSFVEWGASEALRRARPLLLAVRFDVRARPKPFTGVAVFDNPDQVNPLPSVDDIPGSALDAQMLSLYIWLAATRYEEYRSATVCVCLAESISQAYIVAPPEFKMGAEGDLLPLTTLRDSLHAWMA